MRPLTRGFASFSCTRFAHGAVEPFGVSTLPTTKQSSSWSRCTIPHHLRVPDDQRSEIRWCFLDLG